MCQRKWASLRGGGFSPQNDGLEEALRIQTPSQSSRFDGPNPISTIGLVRVNPEILGHTNGSLGRVPGCLGMLRGLVFSMIPGWWQLQRFLEFSPQMFGVS